MPSITLSSAARSSDAAVRNMFEARKRVFVDLLKWDVPVLNDRYEIDQFDTPHANYVILTGDDVSHRASARLLRTDRAHILGELFPALCESAVPTGINTREITRFCIEPTLSRADRRIARNQLVTALVQHALAEGVTDYTAVANLAWYRQIADFGWKCQALGPPRYIDGECLLALHIQIDADTPDDLKETGIFTASDYHLADAGAMQ
jgi:N-acyl-L-homoserine lactone synthetase